MRYEVMIQAMETLPDRDFRALPSSIPPADLKLKTEIENALKEKLKKVQGLRGAETSVTVVSFG